MPLSIKAFFVVVALGIVFQLLGLIPLARTGIFFFGLKVIGPTAVITMISIIVLNFVLLAAVWRRLTWAWKFGIGLESIAVLTILLTIPRIPEIIARTIDQNIQNGTASQLYNSALSTSVLGMMLAVLLSLVFMMLLSHKRDYFVSTKGFFGKRLTNLFEEKKPRRHSKKRHKKRIKRHK